MDRSWTLTYRTRPWTLNGERKGGKGSTGGRYGTANLTREWREEFCRLAQVQRVRPLQWLNVEVAQLCRDRRLPDVGACLPAVKAAVDGLVDADVIPNDSPRYVRSLLFTAPTTIGYDALSLRITGPMCSTGECERREMAEQARLVRHLTGR
jgi:hypothetical protein